MNDSCCRIEMQSGHVDETNFSILIAALAYIVRRRHQRSRGARVRTRLLKIGAADATNHYDQEMVVTGKVAQVTIRPTRDILEPRQAFPDSPFTVVIFHGHSSFYGDANALKGKSIEISGKSKTITTSRKSRWTATIN